MNWLRDWFRRTFVSLKVRNYRLYFVGQGISLCGNWMQTVAMGWLVLQLTGSGTELGGVLAVLYLPIFAAGPFMGSVIDRFEKQRLLFATQSLLGLCALVIAILVWTNVVAIWMIYVLAFAIGSVSALDMTLRQTLVHDMVGPDHLRNAITLNSVLANTARAIGPLIAGSMIALVGIAACFFLNALSFVAVLVILRLMDARQFHHSGATLEKPKAWSALPRYIATSVPLMVVLGAMAVIGTLSYEFQVSLPLLAQHTFNGDASTYALLLSAMGAGSVAGGLFAASRTSVSLREFVFAAALFGACMCATALSSTLFLAVAGMLAVGFFSIILTSSGNTILQLESASHMRASVLSLWTMAIFGSTLIGAPLIGYVGEHESARAALGVGGLAALMAALLSWLVISDKLPSLPISALIRMLREEEDVVEQSPKV